MRFFVCHAFNDADDDDHSSKKVSERRSIFTFLDRAHSMLLVLCAIQETWTTLNKQERKKGKHAFPITPQPNQGRQVGRIRAWPSCKPLTCWSPSPVDRWPSSKERNRRVSKRTVAGQCHLDSPMSTYIHTYIHTYILSSPTTHRDGGGVVELVPTLPDGGVEDERGGGRLARPERHLLT